MRIVFMGTPEFAVPSLEALADNFDVALAVTRPDAVRGRGKRLEPSPVKECAERLGIDIIEANRMTPEVIEQVRACGAALCVVAAYGCILPDDFLALFELGCINVHASLLPRLRGAAPVQRAVLAGDELVGASIMQVVHELDAGAYCAQVSTPAAGKTAGELLDEVGRLGASALVDAVRDIEAGRAEWHEQDESLVTYAHKIEKAEMRLDPTDTATGNVRRVLASTDAAPARCVVAGKGVRIMHAATCDDMVPQGSVVVSGGRVVLGCAEGALEVLEVKPDGKRQMPASAWAAGLRGDSLTWERL